jgi:hypothetical protein
VPLIAGAGVADNANGPAVLLAVSVVFGFLARTPAELALRRKAHRAANSGWAVVFGAVAAGAVVALLAGYGRLWLLPLGIAVISGPAMVVASRPLRVRWREFGVLLVVVSLSALAPAAHYAAVGNIEATGLWLWPLAGLYGGSGVMYVRMLLDKGGGSSERIWHDRRLLVILYHAMLVAAVALVIAVGEVPTLAAVAFAPLLAKVAYRLFRAPDHLNLTKTGLFEASQATVFAILLVAAHRIG